MSPRNAIQSEQMRAAALQTILRAALEVFGERGFFHGSTDEVARRAGVSKGLVFNYFPTKDDLLRALMEKHLSDALQVWEEGDFPGPPREQLQYIFDRTLDHVRANSQIYRLYYSLLFQPGTNQALSAAAESVKPRVERYYTRLAAAFHERDAKRAKMRALAFQAALNGVVQFLILQPELPASLFTEMREHIIATSLLETS